MSTTTTTTTHRRWGRAHSPPTWAWYEQLQPEDLCSDRSDDDEDEDEDEDDSEEQDSEEDSSEEGEVVEEGEVDIMDVDQQQKVVDNTTSTGEEEEPAVVLTSEMKGKSRAVTPPPPPPPPTATDSAPSTPSKKKRSKQPRQPVYNSRPILTIKSSQGFVWNQDLFVPSYIKDRYFVSHSPPLSSRAHHSSSSRMSIPMPMLASSADTLNDYEVDVVEIRVTGDELRGL